MVTVCAVTTFSTTRQKQNQSMKKLLSLLTAVLVTVFTLCGPAFAQTFPLNRIKIESTQVADGPIIIGSPQVAAQFSVTTNFTALVNDLSFDVSDKNALLEEIIVWYEGRRVARKSVLDRTGISIDADGGYVIAIPLPQECVLAGVKRSYTVELVTKNNGLVWDYPDSVVRVTPFWISYDLQIGAIEGRYPQGAIFSATDAVYAGEGFTVDSIGEVPDMVATTSQNIFVSSVLVTPWSGGFATLSTFTAIVETNQLGTILPTNVRLTVGGQLVSRVVGGRSVPVLGRVLPLGEGRAKIFFEGFSAQISPRGSVVKVSLTPGATMRKTIFTVAPVPSDWVVHSLQHPRGRLQHDLNAAFAATTISVR